MTTVNGSSGTPPRPASDGEVVAVFEAHSGRLPPLGTYVRELWQRRRFVQASARAQIRGQRSSMIAGQAWAVLDPLFQAALYWLLFAILRGGQGGRGTAEGLLLLIGCLFLFDFTRIALTDGARAVTSGRALLMNSSLPRALLPVTAIYKGLLELIPAGLVYLVIFLAFGQTIGPGVVFLPLIVAIHTAMNLGLALIFATLSVYIRDVANMLSYFTRVLLFVTPVLYPVSFLSTYPAIERVLIFNPLFPVFAAYQEIITGGAPTIGQVVLSIFWAALLLTAGTYLFLSRERAFALHI
jgi:teichoic acid transport system permease protein